MLDRREYTSNEGPHNEATPGNAESSRALQPYVNRDTGLSLPTPPEGADYAELFARLQKLIDNATQTIRDLRRENTELNARVSQLDAYIQMRADTVDNQEELQKSASRLEELLTLQSTLAMPPTGESRPASIPPTPLRAYEPIPPVPAPTPAVPISAAPVNTAPAPEIRRDPAPVVQNEHPSLRETTPFIISPAVSASAPTPPPATVSVAAPLPPAAAPRIDVEAERAIIPASELVMQPAASVAAEPVMARVEPRMESKALAPTMPAPPMAPSATPFTAPAREASSAPSPLPTRRPAPVPVNGNEKVTGTYTLVVYPFTRFSDLGQFQSVLQELVGIHDIQVRRFAQGTLEMRLGYDGNVPLPQALHNLSVGIEDVEEEEPYRLRVRLDLNHAS